jgi:hypothetical protein
LRVASSIGFHSAPWRSGWWLVKAALRDLRSYYVTEIAIDAFGWE